jgi:hypothetical protein
MPSVTQGLIDFALAPPIGVMNDHLDGNGPYGSGNHTLTTWDNSGSASLVSDTFGVVVNFNGAIPPKLGLKIGYTDGGLIVADQFDMRLLQLVVQHQLLSGAWVITQIENIDILPITLRWAEALPGRIGLYVAPGIAVDLFYLLVA